MSSQNAASVEAARKVWLAAKEAWLAQSLPSTRAAYFVAADNYRAWQRVKAGAAA